MMFDAMTALLSLPRVISHRFNKSRMTVTRNLRQHSSLSAAHARTWHPCIRAIVTLPQMQCRRQTVMQPRIPILLLLCHAAADAADRPAQRVERAPREVLPIHLHHMQ